MNSGIKKRLLVWATAVVVSMGSCFAAGLANKVVDIQFEETEEGVTANIITERNTDVQIRATKAGQYYNIILPNFEKGNNSTYSPGGLVESVRLSTIPSSTGGDAYTKIQIKLREGVNLFAKSSVYVEEEKEENSYNGVPDFETPDEQMNYEYPQPEPEMVKDDFVDNGFEDFSVEEFSEPVVNEVPQPAPELPQITPPELEANEVNAQPVENEEVQKKESKAFDTNPKEHMQEILGYLIGIVSVILLIAVFYLKGKDDMNRLCGDMSVDVADKDQEAKAKAAKEKAEKKEEKKKKEKSKPAVIAKKAPVMKGALARFQKATAKKQKENEAKINEVKVEEVVTTPVLEVPNEVIDEENVVLDMDAISVPVQEEDVVLSVVPQVVVEQEIPQNIPTVSSPVVQVEKVEQEEQEDYDVDDFLASFVDEEEEAVEVVEGSENVDETSSSTEEGQTANEVDAGSDDDNSEEDVEFANPLDDLIDDVLSTQEMAFSDADMEAIQKRLQSDLSPEMLENLTAAINANLVKEEEVEPETTVQITLEVFDGMYPEFSDAEIDGVLNNVKDKFNDIDRQIIFETMSSFEMSEDAIIGARLERDIQEKENIEYYDSEQDYAFTLIKPQEVENLEDLVVAAEEAYPDLDEVDFTGDAIFEEFAFAKPDIPEELEFASDEAPSIEDIERAMSEIKLVSMSEEEIAQYPEKPEPEIKDESILSEFHLIKPEVESKSAEDNFTTTIFSSTDDIEAQFKALGIEFDEEPKVAENTQLDNFVSVMEADPYIDMVESFEEPKFSFSDAEICAKHVIDSNTELYICNYDSKAFLVGVKRDNVKILHEFKEGENPVTISAREAETTEYSTRYIVRAGKFKSVIEVEDACVSMVMTL